MVVRDQSKSINHPPPPELLGFEETLQESYLLEHDSGMMDIECKGKGSPPLTIQWVTRYLRLFLIYCRIMTLLLAEFHWPEILISWSCKYCQNCTKISLPLTVFPWPIMRQNQMPSNCIISSIADGTGTMAPFSLPHPPCPSTPPNHETQQQLVESAMRME